jgi:hypothetical protein
LLNSKLLLSAEVDSDGELITSLHVGSDTNSEGSIISCEFSSATTSTLLWLFNDRLVHVLDKKNGPYTFE